MTPAEIKDVIQSDLKSGEVETSLDIQKCLVEPQLIDCYNDSQDESPEKMWLVFQEDPSQKCGYSIVFDEADGSFGLAIISETGKRVCIGLYGSFLETLNGM